MSSKKDVRRWRNSKICEQQLMFPLMLVGLHVEWMGGRDITRIIASEFECVGPAAEAVSQSVPGTRHTGGGGGGAGVDELGALCGCWPVHLAQLYMAQAQASQRSTRPAENIPQEEERSPILRLPKASAQMNGPPSNE